VEVSWKYSSKEVLKQWMDCGGDLPKCDKGRDLVENQEFWLSEVNMLRLQWVTQKNQEELDK
jgi:hypothetical protein